MDRLNGKAPAPSERWPVSWYRFREILVEAGAIVHGLYQRGAGASASAKADGSLLTQADRECNEFLEHELGLLLPEAGWLSEETADGPERLARRWVWVVDPLDGTKEFTRGIPEFAVSVGLVCGGQVIGGGVLNPVTNEGGIGGAGDTVDLWGWGARPAPANSLQVATASVSRSEVEEGSIRAFLNLVGCARPVGSVAYKLLRVAAGVDDLTFSVQPKSEWDLCGGVGLLQAVGKVYCRWDSVPVQFNQSTVRIPVGAVAGSKELAEAFLARYRETLGGSPEIRERVPNP
jgi:myo-inositol-1(or 4)-monophosphatase